MGELVDPNLSEERTIRFAVKGKRGYGYLDSTNRLADEEAIFNILHLLHHLNGAASHVLRFMSRLNPSIVRLELGIG